LKYLHIVRRKDIALISLAKTVEDKIYSRQTEAMVDSATKDKIAGGDTVNPLKSDAELLTLLKKIDKIKKHKSFQRWKGQFLSRLEEFLYESGMAPAEESCTKFATLLERLLKMAEKVQGFIKRGELCDAKKTVKASLALSEMCNTLTTVVNETEALIPALRKDEQRKGFNKFHLGAALIRQGFYQYGSMMAIEAFCEELGPALGSVADRQQHDLFQFYRLVFQRFCDVMADLNLYTVMIKCQEFVEVPEEEESSSAEPITVRLTIQTKDDPTKTISLEVEVTETVGNIKEYIAEGCQIAPYRQVLQWNGKRLDDKDQTLEGLGIQDAATFTVEPFRVPVTVNTYDGKVINMMVDPTGYVADLKRQLEPESGIPARNQRLFQEQGQAEFDDPNQSLADVIQAGSVLRLEPNKLQVTVQTPDGKSHGVEISLDDPIESVKARIATITGIPQSKQVVQHKGKELPIGTTVREDGIQEGDLLNVHVYRVPVTVNTMDGKTIEIMVDPTDYLSDIKCQLEAESGIPAKNQCLFQGGVHFADNTKTADDYGIKAGSVLDLEPKSMEITVFDHVGKNHLIIVEPSDSSEIIKDKIAKITGLEPRRQVVKFQDKEVPSGVTARALGLRDGAGLVVNIRKVPVVVNVMDGKKIELMVDPTDYLSEMKRQLEAESEIPAENQCLFKDGKELGDNNNTAADYGIEGGTVLILEPKSMHINVDTPDGKSHSIEVTPSDTTACIKKKVAGKTGLTVPQQVLKFNKKIMEDGDTIRKLGIQDYDTILAEIFRVPVVVNTMDGKQIKVMIDPTATMDQIKHELEPECDLPVSNQRLYLEGSELDDTKKSAEEYGIKSGSVLDLEPKTMAVTVCAPDGKTHVININPSDTTMDIKEKIAAKTGLTAPQQVLKLNGKELPNGKMAKDMGVRDGSTLTVDIFTVPVIVNTMDGKQIKVKVDPTQPIFDIKSKLELESGLPAKNQRLFLNGAELEDGKVASQYGIQGGTVLDMEPKAMQISVKSPDGRLHQVDVCPSDNIETLKEKVAAKTGIPVQQQILKKDGNELPKGKMAKEIGIKDGDVLAVELLLVPVTVNTMDGKMIKLLVDPTNKLADIKRQLEPECGIPMENQRLFMEEKELPDDGKQAGSYGIQSGSMLDLEPKMIHISVETPDGKVHRIDISPSDTELAIKKKIADASSFAVPRQVLEFEGKEIPKGKSAKDAGIQDGAKLSAKLFTIPITVREENGNTFPLRVEPSSSIDDIKNLVKQETGLERSKQILSLGDEPLDNGRKSAEECGIVPGSRLTLDVVRDPIIFVDIKCGTLFAMERNAVIEGRALTPLDGNRLDFAEAARDSAAREKIADAMKGSPKLGVATQVVVQATAIDDYEMQEAENVKNLWGVNLKKRQKNEKGEEFIFVDPKTGSTGELSRTKYLSSNFITPVVDAKYGDTLKEREQDTIMYDKYVAMIRLTFGIKFE
jgi:ubiquitin-like protein Nedd8